MKKIFDDGPVYDTDIEKAIGKAGVKRGDTLFVHSQLYSFGRLGEVKTKEELVSAFVDALVKNVGDGTIIVPTFTFSFCKTGVYDSEKTPSEAGLLSEIFRKKNDVVRSAHPIYSVAVLGKDKDYFLGADTRTCFGEDGIFGRVHKKDVKIVFIGIGAEGLSQIHYVEELLKVPYRYMKKFIGKADNRPVEVEFYVRDLEHNAELDMKGKFAAFCEEKKILKTVSLGNSSISAVREKVMHEKIMEAMTANPCAFLKRPYKAETTRE